METQKMILKDRYSIVSLLGRGGMGEVFLAEDKLLSRQVAVKKVVYGDNEFLLKSAEKEAMVLARLQHQCLPKVLDYFNEDHAQYIVMEYIPGNDLSKLLQANQAALPVEQVMGWVNILLDTLEYLHRQNPPVVHRDIKPQNIKVTDEGKLFLLDFGLVKDTPTRVRSDSLSLSVYGYSQSYAPLEQINGDPTSVQTDVYELCATIYHLITNVKPADALDRATRKIGHKPDSLRPAHEVNPNVSIGLSQTLEAGLQLSSEERIKSIPDLRQRLTQVRYKPERIVINVGDAEGKIASAPAVAPVKRGFMVGKRRQVAVVAGVIVFLGLASLLGYRAVKGAEAQSRFDEAKTIESGEALLSPRACSKYQEVDARFLASSVAGDLGRKLVDCGVVRNMLDQTKAAERTKGLNHETAASYKEIVDKFPGSAQAKEANTKVSQFETARKVTLQAWNELQEADNSASKKREEGSTTSQYFHESAYLYGKISLENVDPILVEHIKNSIETFNEGDSVFSELEQEISKIEAGSQKIIELGQQYGAASEHGAAKGALAGRMVADDWEQKELAKLKEQKADLLTKYAERVRNTAEMDKTVGVKLKQKYNVEFIDRY
jgi:serine/threonine protein kinase